MMMNLYFWAQTCSLSEYLDKYQSLANLKAIEEIWHMIIFWGNVSRDSIKGNSGPSGIFKTQVQVVDLSIHPPHHIT